jgi:hypothetical protein
MRNKAGGYGFHGSVLPPFRYPNADVSAPETYHRLSFCACHSVVRYVTPPWCKDPWDEYMGCGIISDVLWRVDKPGMRLRPYSWAPFLHKITDYKRVNASGARDPGWTTLWTNLPSQIKAVYLLKYLRHGSFRYVACAWFSGLGCISGGTSWCK